jgi:hypothetical protein
MLPLAILGVAGSAFLGCGGGSDSSSSSTSSFANKTITVTTTSISKPGYIKKAKAVCGKTGARMLKALGKPSDKSEAERIEEISSTAFAPAVEDEVTELQKLGAPHGEVKEIEALLHALQDGLAALDEREITSLEAFGIGFRQFDRLARTYGLEDCSFELA